MCQCMCGHMFTWRFSIDCFDLSLGHVASYNTITVDVVGQLFFIPNPKVGGYA